MTRGRLVAKVAAEFGLDTTAATEELTLLQEWANEGVIDVLLETHCAVELGSLALVAGTSDYQLPATVMAIDEFDPVGGQDVEVVSLDAIYDQRRISSFPGTVLMIAVEGDRVFIYPTPSVAQTLNYVYVKRPDPMTADANDPAVDPYGRVPIEYHQAIESFMGWKAALYDEKRAPYSAEQYRTFYESRLVNVRKRKRKKAQRGLNAGRVGYPGRGIPRRNDIYPVR